MKRILTFLLTASYFFSSHLLAIVTDSIIPFMEGLENGSNIQQNRYSTSQLEEINAALKDEENKIRVVSYNILFNLYDESEAPENRWPNRLPRLVEYLGVLQPDILCVQEPQQIQIDQLLEHIGNDYAFYFEESAKEKTRDRDGIFYRKERFDLIEGRTWAIAHEKAASAITMVYLRDRVTGKEMRVWNCHLPLYSADAREQVAKAAAALIRPYSAQEAIVLTGDLNSFANRPDLPLLHFLDGDRVVFYITEGGVEDSMRKSLLGHVGPISSFTNAPLHNNKFAGEGDPGIILDHIFISRAFTVLAHGIDPGQVDGHFSSDHMPVIADLIQK